MQTSVLLNDTKSIHGNQSKTIDCAKECPCGVPVIPVPDEWLEVMVSGGFKVWHIIFIIIAFIVTLVVVYCCFHRCRIPRTKQEIEADLMRTNLASRFRDYLQELPNEPTTFLEALKKVQDIEEKMEQDDAMLSRDLGARKRMGWLKLKGKGDKEANPKEEKDGLEIDAKEADTNDEKVKAEPDTEAKSEPSNVKEAIESVKQTATIATVLGSDTATVRQSSQTDNLEPMTIPLTKPVEPKAHIDKVKHKHKDHDVDSQSKTNGLENHQPDEQNKNLAKVVKRRKQKPNLSRTKGAREKSIEPSSPPAPPSEGVKVDLERTKQKELKIDTSKVTGDHLEPPPKSSRSHQHVKKSHRVKKPDDISSDIKIK